MPAIQLTPAQRKVHRAEAHHLDPIVMIGNDGLTPAVKKESDAALNAHGLIKVRVFSDDRPAREAMLQTLADELAPRRSSTSASCWCCGGPSPRRKEVDEDRMPGPRDVKVLKYSKRGGQRPEVKTLRVLGNQRLTPGGTVKRAKARSRSRSRSGARQTEDAESRPGRRAAAPHPVHEVGHQVRARVRQPPLCDGAPPPRRRLQFRLPDRRRPASGPKCSACRSRRSNLELKPGQKDHAWKKLTTFEADLHGLRGTALFIDLDVVIVGSLDAFFEQPGEFLIIHDYARPWRRGASPATRRSTASSSARIRTCWRIFATTWTRCGPSTATSRSTCRPSCRQGKLAYWPEAWCPSFKYHGIPDWPTNYWTEPFVPEGARIMIFHGECNPPDALAGKRNRHSGSSAAPTGSASAGRPARPLAATIRHSKTAAHNHWPRYMALPTSATG